MTSWMTDGHAYKRINCVPKTQRDVAAFIRENCRYESVNGSMFGKAPGDRYTSQFYLASLTHNGVMMKRVCEAFGYLLHDHGIEIGEIQLAGRHWSALPILGAMSYHFGVNTFSIRRERKTYGKHNLIEGTVDSKPVLLVDDLANSTNSFAFCQSFLRSNGIPVMDKCLCILNKKRKDDAAFLWDKYSEQEIIWLTTRCQVTDK